MILQAGGAQRAAGLGDLDDRVGDVGDLRLGRAVRERRRRASMPCVSKYRRVSSRVLGVHPRRRRAGRAPSAASESAADREHDPDRSRRRLRVVQLGEADDVGARSPRSSRGP